MTIEKLVEWRKHPGQFDADGLQSPTIVAVDKTSNIVRSFDEKGYVPPTRIVQNGEGGIVIELECWDILRAIEILYDGQIETRVFLGCRLLH